MGLLTRVWWLRSLFPPRWGMLRDTDSSVSIGTELCPCWLWLERDEAIGDVAAGGAAPGVAAAVASAQCRGWEQLLPTAARVSFLQQWTLVSVRHPKTFHQLRKWS